MKNFFRSFFGKGLLYAAVLISTIVLVLSVTGAAFMIYSDYYTRSEESITQEITESVVNKFSVQAFSWSFDEYTGEFPDSKKSDIGNFIFRITDEDGKELVKSSSDAGQYPYKMYFTVLPPHQAESDRYFISDFSDNINIYKQIYKDNHYAKLYIVEGAVNPELPFTDDISLTLGFHHFLYPLKTGIYVIGIAAFALMAASFIGLMCVAGRRPKKDEIVPWYFHKVPFDIITAAMVIFVAFSVILLDEANDLAAGIFSFSWMMFVPLYFMSFAVRVKTHTIFKNNVIYMILNLLWKGLKAVGRFIWTILTNMKLLWKLILTFSALMFFWLVTIAVHSREFEGVLFALVLFIVFPALILITLQLDKIRKGAQKLAEGHFDHVIDTKFMLPELKRHAVNLNSMASAQKIALEEKLKSERMKTELITNVSHDIKTPLTSIINYADLISKEESTNEKTKEYSEVLIRQSVRLKRLLEDLVEASKASTGNLEVDLQPCDAQVFVTQSAGEYEEKFKQYDLTLITNVPEQPIRIMADGRRMQRVFDNLLNNACKYSLPGTRVYVELKENDKEAVFTFKNTSKEQLNMSEEELMERFTRGDSSRNTEGSGLGLSIAGNLAELQNGKLRLTTDGDLFKATLSFPKI